MPSAGATWSLIDSVVQAALSLGIFLILARLLPIDVVGLGILCISIYQIANLPVDTLFHDAVIQRDNITTEDIVSAFSGALMIGALSAALLFLFTVLFSDKLSEAQILPVMGALAIAILANAVATVPLALSRRALDFKRIALVQGFARLTANVVAALMALNDFGVWTFAAQQIIGSILIALILAFEARFWVFRDFRYASMVSLLKFGVFSTLSSFIWMASFRAFFVFVGYFFGNSSLAYLGVAQRIVDTPRDVLSLAIGRYGLATLSRQQKSASSFAGEYFKQTNLFTLATLPLFCILIIFPDVLVRYLIGERWLPSVPSVQLLALAALVHFHSFLVPIAINALGRPGLTARVSLYATLATIGLMLTIGTQSYFHAMLTWVGRSVLGYIGTAYSLSRISNVRLALHLRSIGRSLILVVLSLGVMWGIRWAFVQLSLIWTQTQ